MDRLMRIGEGRVLKRLENIAKHVNAIESDFEEMTDEELRGQTDEFRKRLDDGETLDDILPEAFATVREASRRVLGKRHFDVQIMGGAALHLGNIAEMKTGEGKTLVATLPAYLNALTGKGVHVVTVNDYLVKFQSEQMGRVHHFLGLSTAAILTSMTPAERREAYHADITYGTNNEFGFDYLRDNMALQLEDCVQRGHHFAIVDEVDSILVDEARTPLIISGPAEDNHDWYPEFARLAASLTPGEHYEVDEKKKTVSVLEPGIDVVEDRLGIDNLYESANTPLISYLQQALKAKDLFKRDRDYVVMNGDVLIVDEHTGRTLDGRRYSEGLHQAIEAKEKVQIKDEYQTLATVTLQNFFRMYDKLAGMTGTAKTEESEFQKIYGLGVLPIRTNKPMIREDQRDLIYRTEEAKFDAIVEDVAARHEAGQPVLIGTASVAKSELISARLKKAGVPHNVLNAKNHAKEAQFVAEAGRKGSVTVATNMAGRGTDIILGGNAEFLADRVLQKKGLNPEDTPEEYEAAWADTLAELEDQVEAEHAEVVELGGLYVVGSERHESRRIDNQLRGRSGRQGDPGESRFYLSLGDTLMRLFKSDLVEWVLTTLKIPDDQPIENRQVTKSIESAQKQVESQNFEMRKNVLKYDDVMNRQRHTIYADRRKVLEGADVSEQIRAAVDRVVGETVRRLTAEGFAEDWDYEAIWAELEALYPVSLKREDYEGGDLSSDELAQEFVEDAREAYARRETELGEDNMRELERQVLLTVLDRKWREHLYEMDYLREGIGLRAMAQRDPLVEYQREGGDMFNAMMEALLAEVVGFVFRVEVQQPAQPRVAAVTDADGKPVSVADLTNGRAPADDADAGDHGGGADDADGDDDADADADGADDADDADDADGKSEPDAADDGEPELVGAAAEREGAEPGSLRIKGAGRRRSAPKLRYSAPDADGEATESADAEADEYAGVGRNQQCPCGSGKKFKLCHGKRG
ncbi:preprotein translocase subunit SecA [Naumannella cuiyingiana]|uniref:preprotein translocase subunit SecA n=1 Tax=Naumannella cuiyingiana TaxID=1347891 RepID=UPI001C545084|nr:preprotein translocase subunit SecA [Naumannella cuiyingiana]